MSEPQHNPQQCPCQQLESTPLSFSACCSPHLSGATTPQTAQALMRSRYSAYALGDIDYLINSWWPEQQKQLDVDAITLWSNNSDWRGLKIHNYRQGSAEDTEGWVDFSAFWIESNNSGQLQQHRENSYFKRLNKRWYFIEARASNSDQPVEKLSRNSLCPCGSGKKYKRCCLTFE